MKQNVEVWKEFSLHSRFDLHPSFHHPKMTLMVFHFGRAPFTYRQGYESSLMLQGRMSLEFIGEGTSVLSLGIGLVLSLTLRISHFWNCLPFD